MSFCLSAYNPIIFFELAPSEITEMENIKGNSLVRALIILASDQLAAGEIKLTEYTEEELQAARARLDEKREKRQKRDSRKN